MNVLLNKYKWIKYAIGAFIIALGITIIILACLSIGQIANVINIVVAVALIVIGVVFACANFFTETHKTITLSLLLGALGITCGVIMLVSKFRLGIDLLHTYFLVYFIASFALAIGVCSIVKAITMIIYRQKASLITLMFVLGTVSIVIGILGLVFAADLQQPAYIILGVVLVVVGISIIVVSSISKREKEQ